MSNSFLKIYSNQTLMAALKCMHEGQQNCVVVVDAEDYLEGILTYGDIKRFLFKKSSHTSNSHLSVDVSLCLIDILQR